MLEKSQISEISDTVFNELFEKYYPKLMFYATQFLPEEESKDVVQEAYLDLWKNRESLDYGEQISSYLYRLVFTKSMNILKRQKIKGKYADAVELFNNQRILYYESGNDEIIKRLESDDISRALISAVTNLPTQCQKVFRMSYLHDMKNKEIADALELSVRTVDAHIYKALKLLRIQLKYLLVFFCTLLTTSGRYFVLEDCYNIIECGG